MKGVKNLSYTAIAGLFVVAAILTVIFAVWISDNRKNHTVAFDHNALVCVTRPYIEGSKARAFQSMHDTSQTPAVRERAASAYVSAQRFLNGLITIPFHFDCAPLIKQIAQQAKEST